MLLYAQLVVVTCVYALVRLGIDFDLYDTLWWWDVVLHFIGGVWAGLLVVTVFSVAGEKKSFWLWLAAVLLIGVMWEVFENFIGIGGSVFFSYKIDTAKDLMLDVLGALTAYRLKKRLHL